MQKPNEADRKAMDLLMSRGIISRDVKLADLVELSAELADLSPGDEVAGWTFISPSYVYTGDKVADIGQDVVQPR